LYRRFVGNYSNVPCHIALSGGEDYELLFAASPQKRKKVLSLARSLKIPLTCVGEILPAKEGLHLIGKGGKEIELYRLGFDHFK
jgi:thiamine-monophosphate kinase